MNRNFGDKTLAKYATSAIDSGIKNKSEFIRWFREVIGLSASNEYLKQAWEQCETMNYGKIDFESDLLKPTVHVLPNHKKISPNDRYKLIWKNRTIRHGLAREEAEKLQNKYAASYGETLMMRDI